MGRAAGWVRGRATGLWSGLKREIVVAAVTGVLMTFYPPPARGQGGGDLLLVPGRTTPEPASALAATVSVATLRIPREAWKHFDRASSAAEHHDLEAFERESAKALAIAPEFAQMYLLRATVEVNAFRFEAGVEDAQVALRFDGGTMWARVILAGAYNGMRRFQDALLVLNAQRGKEAESWQSMYERARAEIGVRETIAALHWSALLLNAAPREFNDIHLVRANALILADRRTEAAAQLTVYLDAKGPQSHREQAMMLRDAMIGGTRATVRQSTQFAGR